MSIFPRLRIEPEATAKMTKPFVAATLLLAPVFGSLVSAAMVVAALLGVFQHMNNNFKISANRPQLVIFKLIVVWFSVEAFFGLLHFNGWMTIIEIGENLPFLGYILFVSALEHSSKPDLRRFVHLASPIAAFAALSVAFLQVVLGAPRAEGGAGNPVPFAALCLIVFSCCMLTALETHGRARLLGIAGAGAAAASVIFSGTRGLWPCLVILPVALAALYRKELRMAARREYIAIALILTAGLALTHKTIEKRLVRLDSEIEHFQSGSGKITSLKEHTLIWQAGWSLLSEAPLTGHGLGVNGELMRQRTSGTGSAPIGYSHFHNAILTEGVQSGIIGIFALISMFFTPLALAFRSRMDEAGRHGFAIILVTTIIYAASGATGIMFGHDLMDMGWICAIAYGSFMVFGHGAAEHEPFDTGGKRGNGPTAP